MILQAPARKCHASKSTSASNAPLFGAETKSALARARSGTYAARLARRHQAASAARAPCGLMIIRALT